MESICEGLEDLEIGAGSVASSIAGVILPDSGTLGALRARKRTGRGQSISATPASGTEPLDDFVSTIVRLAAVALGIQHQDQTCGGVGVGVAVSMQGNLAFTSFDPGLRESKLTVAYDRPLFEPMVRLAPPVSFSKTPGRVAPSCLRRRHNRSILRETG
jgi:crotonobetainyl-CoA:carnitine CoA-transferase CaiB-like acyl-CoA transferase